MNTNIFQAVSSSASFGWDGNFDTYGDETQVRGWGGWPPREAAS